MSFDSDIRRMAKKTGIEVEEAIRKVAFDAHKMIAKKTPKDNGTAQANWNVSVGNIDKSVDMEATKIQTPMLRKGDGLKPIYIVNSLPYIRRLEHGHSKQARNPNGMVRVTINEFKNYYFK